MPRDIDVVMGVRAIDVETIAVAFERDFYVDGPVAHHRRPRAARGGALN